MPPVTFPFQGRRRKSIGFWFVFIITLRHTSPTQVGVARPPFKMWNGEVNQVNSPLSPSFEPLIQNHLRKYYLYCINDCEMWYDDISKTILGFATMRKYAMEKVEYNLGTCRHHPTTAMYMERTSKLLRKLWNSLAYGDANYAMMMTDGEIIVILLCSLEFLPTCLFISIHWLLEKSRLKFN